MRILVVEDDEAVRGYGRGFRHNEQSVRVVEVLAKIPGTALFAHCGVLSVGARKKLGLDSRADLLVQLMQFQRMATSAGADIEPTLQ